MIRKVICAFLLVAIFACTAFARAHNVGVLTKLNSTQEEFQAYMDAALSAGMWTLFTTDDSEPAFFVFYDSLVAMQMGLNSGEVDEIDLPETIGEYMINVNPNYAIACISVARPAALAFGFNEKNAGLRDRFNTALKAMKEDKTLRALKAQYIDDAGAGAIEAVKFEKFDGAETVRVAVTGDLPPIDFIAPDGMPAGFNTAILAEIGKRLQLNIEIMDIDSGARAASLASGRADVAFWFQVYRDEGGQPDVPSEVILSDSYYEWNKFLHIRKR